MNCWIYSLSIFLIYIFFSYLRFGNDAFVISSILETLAVGITDKYSLERVINLLSKSGAGSATNSANYVINQIKTNIKWFNNYEKKICDFLKLDR